ncbi:MAG: hypothetical protein JKY57_01485 [Kordiimonadaceae bacterium]|nr:hypothetical protein [Kordiimonadaceae bacterium]
MLTQHTYKEHISFWKDPLEMRPFHIIFKILVSIGITAAALSFGAPILAQNVPTISKTASEIPTKSPSKAPSFDDESVQRSVGYMLKRAQLTRTLATEYLEYLYEHRDNSNMRLMEDAAQVMAFDLVCEDEKIQTKVINNIATDTSFRLAMMAGESAISERLARITAKQSVNDRMELVGDIATTVFMYEIGRRRGLYDALVTDYGTKRFCAGMVKDMRNRYNDLASNLEP